MTCIGAFDGLHLGHRALIGHALDRARNFGLPSVCLSFEPLPREYFAGEQKPPRLSLPRMKFEGLRQIGFDLVGLLRFNKALTQLSAEDFVTRVLVGRLRVREVWVGEDFGFGQGRKGNVALLREMGKAHQFTVQALEPVSLGDERISASAVRAHLQKGELDRAANLLGRHYSIAGRVIRGQQLGRKLGYPTANIQFAGKVPALSGIYATRVHGVGAKPYASVSSLGTRPTVDGTKPLLEAHLFNFDGDLYGRRIEVEFVAKLRDEEKFDNLDALIEQMDRDAQMAREILRADLI